MKIPKKKSERSNGLVYSTDPHFKFEELKEQEETILSANQKLKVRLDAKHRAGKLVTLVEGFIGNNNDLQDLSKKLKTFCGTGGSAKEGEIIIQGDQREKVLQWFLKNGYPAKKV